MNKLSATFLGLAAALALVGVPSASAAVEFGDNCTANTGVPGFDADGADGPPRLHSPDRSELAV